MIVVKTRDGRTLSGTALALSGGDSPFVTLDEGEIASVTLTSPTGDATLRGGSPGVPGDPGSSQPEGG